MRRADRLFEIIQILRRKPTVRAQDIAEALEISERTVYRDIRDLMAWIADRALSPAGSKPRNSTFDFGAVDLSATLE